MLDLDIEKTISTAENCDTDTVIVICSDEAGMLHRESTLDEQAYEIGQSFCKLMQNDQGLMEIKTANWIQIGHLLIVHRRHVEEKGYFWTKWAVDYFPFIKSRRREQCMKLAAYGDEAVPYFFMGLDRAYDYLNKCYKYRNDPDLDYLHHKYAGVLEDQPQTEEERTVFNVKIDIIKNYFKFKNQVNRHDYDRNLVIDVLETGCKFTKQDYDFINKTSVSPGKIAIHLDRMLFTGSSPLNTTQSSPAKISIYDLLCELSETVSEFETKGTIPEYLRIDFLNMVIGRLLKLRDRIKFESTQLKES